MNIFMISGYSSLESVLLKKTFPTESKLLGQAGKVEGSAVAGAESQSQKLLTWDGADRKLLTTGGFDNLPAPMVDIQFIQEARGGSIKPFGFVTREDLTGLSPTEINIKAATDIPVGSKIELVKAKLPESMLEKPLSGNRFFKLDTESVIEGHSLNGLQENYVRSIPSKNVYQRIELGEVKQNIP